jgi:hypothetical protein
MICKKAYLVEFLPMISKAYDPIFKLWKTSKISAHLTCNLHTIQMFKITNLVSMIMINSDIPITFVEYSTATCKETYIKEQNMSWK